MKIAFLSYYSGEVYRGVETFVHELANELSKIGNEVIVYQRGDKLPNTLYKSVSIKTVESSIGVKFEIPFINARCLNIKRFTQEVIRQLPLDLDVIFPTNGQWQSVLCKTWAVRNRKKIIISGQSGPGLDDVINIWTVPDAFVSLTKHQTNWSKSVNPLVKSVTIPNGVNLKKFVKKSKKNNLPIILCVAALVNWKRIDRVIKAVSRLSDVKLMIVGAGEEERRLRELAENLLHGRYEMFSLPHEKMPEVYSKADIFTFSTVPWESFGIVMVEAMASGLAVVATDDPIRREIVGDAGLFVDPENTQEYANVLKRALETNWGDKPRKQAEKFSWDKIALQYDQLFKSL